MTAAPTGTAAPALEEPVALPPEDASLGVFRAVARTDRRTDGICAMTLHAVDVLPGGVAWIAGGCALRARYEGGRLHETRAKPITQQVGPARATCASVQRFSAILARAANEVYTVGTRTCGHDPSGVTALDLERWDGRAFQVVRSSEPRQDPHVSHVEALAAAPDGPLWGLARGDEWHGPAVGGVFRREKGKWGKAVRFALPSDWASERTYPPARWVDHPTLTYESYVAMAATATGGVWVVGKVRSMAKRLQDKGDDVLHGAAWRIEADGRATMTVIDDLDLHDVSVAGDGSVWAVGQGLHRFDGKGWSKVPVPLAAPDRLSSVWARSAGDVWMVNFDKGIYHWDGRSIARAPMESGLEPRSIRGAGDEVWVVGMFAASRRFPVGAPAPGEAVVLGALR